jgi:hypothetical protein
MLAAAKSGDIGAAKELFQRLLGPPVEQDLLERLAMLEQQILQPKSGGESARER